MGKIGNPHDFLTANSRGAVSIGTMNSVNSFAVLYRQLKLAMNTAFLTIPLKWIWHVFHPISRAMSLIRGTVVAGAPNLIVAMLSPSRTPSTSTFHTSTVDSLKQTAVTSAHTSCDAVRTGTGILHLMLADQMTHM